MAKGAKTGGRKRGTPNKKTAELQKKVAAGGTDPLDYLLEVMRDTKASLPDRLEAAKAAAPFVHPRLAAVEVSGSLAMTHEQQLDRLK